MRIAVDARELRGQPTGVGRYLAEILAAWSHLDAGAAPEIVLCAPQAVPLPRGALRATCLTAGAGSGTLWEQRVLPRLVRQAGADVLFAPAYSGPLRCPVPMVLAVHDVSFAAHPEWFGWREGLRRRVVTRLAARRAASVLTLTEFSKREIVRCLGVNADAVVVTSAGVTAPSAASREPFQAAAARGERPRSGPPRVLFVGSIFARRHVPALIEGFAQLAARHRDASLDIVGDNRARPPVDLAAVARRAGVVARVHLHDYVDDGRLAAFYRQATAFAWLSSYEGFGLPPLEALAAGVPGLVLDTPVAREVMADAATYVADVAPASIAAGLERVLFDEAERRRVYAASAAVLRRHSWRACATTVLRVLTAAA